jgi:hypothetical protein
MFQGFVTAGVLSHMYQQVDGAPDVIKGLGRAEWIQILDKAAEVGLLRRVGEGYYTVHPALPWFFHDLLRESFPAHLEWLEKTFAAAYAAYGNYLSELFKAKAELAMSLLQAEEGNLLHALRVARRYRDWNSVAGILYGLRHLLAMQGRWVEWERLIAEIEAEITDANGEPLPGREDLWIGLLGHRSEVANRRRDFVAAPSLNSRRRIAELEDQLTQELAKRDNADDALAPKIQLVVAGVLADPTEGPDSALLEAMGYVRKSERKTGLTRKRKTKETPAK